MTAGTNQQAIPDGCLPFEIVPFTEYVTGDGLPCYYKDSNSGYLRFSMTPLYSWFVNEKGEFVEWESNERDSERNKTLNLNVYCRPERKSSVVGLDWKPYHAEQTCTILLDKDGQRKITFTMPIQVTKAELSRIQAWIALQLLVEGE